MNLGVMTSLDQTEASDKMLIKYFQKAQVIYNLIGLEDNAKLMDGAIATLKDRLAESDGHGVNLAVIASTLLKGAKNSYENNLKICGLTSDATLLSG